METKVCPNCGSPLIKRWFIETYDLEVPEEVYEDWYCSKCKIRWESVLDGIGYSSEEEARVQRLQLPQAKS